MSFISNNRLYTPRINVELLVNFLLARHSAPLTWYESMSAPVIDVKIASANNKTCYLQWRHNDPGVSYRLNGLRQRTRKRKEIEGHNFFSRLILMTSCDHLGIYRPTRREKITRKVWMGHCHCQGHDSSHTLHLMTSLSRTRALTTHC